MEWAVTVMSRVDVAVKNVRWGYMGTFVTYALGFAVRTIIIKILGEAYAGVNGLFTNVLGVLSFTELGIGTALNYSLYKPVAENDHEKIKALMQFYKKAYTVIAIMITIIGLVLLPFTDYLVKEPGDIGNIKVYYIFFLISTVSTYFVSYKYSFVNAMQENYICSILSMISLIATYLFQIIALLISREYIVYLVVGTIIDVLQKIWISVYLNKRYPILCERTNGKLEKKELNKIKNNTKALIIHKIGDVSVHQTDNIIISAFVNVSMVGKVTYYSYFVNAISQALYVMLNAVVGGLGNVISVEKKESQYKVFKIYRFIAFWLFGYASVGLYFTLTKLVIIMVGPKMVVNNTIVLLMLVDFYMIGHRIALNNMKMAGGIFKQDQFIPIIQSVVNLGLSMFLVTRIGVVGVYIGTVMQGIIASVAKPIIIYPELFEISSIHYFVDATKYAGAVIIAAILCEIVDKTFFVEIGIISFTFEVMVISIIINVLFFLLFRKTDECSYLYQQLKRRIK